MSPQFAVSYRFQPERMVYVSVGRGFKAGGFNPASPPGSEAYGEESPGTSKAAQGFAGERTGAGQRGRVFHRLG